MVERRRRRLGLICEGFLEYGQRLAERRAVIPPAQRSLLIPAMMADVEYKYWTRDLFIESQFEFAARWGRSRAGIGAAPGLRSLLCAGYRWPSLFLSLRNPMPDRNDFKALHRVIRFISDLAVGSFFHELRVIGGENVPKTGPIIVCVVFCGAFLGVVGADGGGIGRRRTTT